jgi:hypothetical protein
MVSVTPALPVIFNALVLDAADLWSENWARPGLWGLRGGNSPVLPGFTALAGLALTPNAFLEAAFTGAGFFAFPMAPGLKGARR